MSMKFSGGSDGKESTCIVGDLDLILGLARSPGGGHGNPLHYSCLENPMDRGAWQATVHRVTKSRTQLKRLNTRAHIPVTYSNYDSIKRGSLYLFFSTRNSIFSSCCKIRLQVPEVLSLNGFRSSDFQEEKSSADTWW